MIRVKTFLCSVRSFVRGRRGCRRARGLAAGRDGSENGLIDAGGTHEPYLFIVRRGGQRLVRARRQTERAQSEETIRELAFRASGAGFPYASLQGLRHGGRTSRDGRGGRTAASSIARE